MTVVLAHGGAAGAVAEAAFIIVPILVFGFMARVSRKRREAAEEAEAGEEDEEGAPGPDPESTAP